MSDDEARAPSRLIDWGLAARRLRLSAIGLAALATAGWLTVGLVTGGPELADLGPWVFVALAGMFVVEVVVVGGSAVRGMLRAGERGERLAGGDVGLLPPQIRGSRGRQP